MVTPIRSLARVTVWERTRDRIEIRGDQDCAFDYYVNGIRRGYETVETIQPNVAYRPSVQGVPFGTQYPKAIQEMLINNGTLNADLTPNLGTAKKNGWNLVQPEAVPANQRWWESPAVRAAAQAEANSVNMQPVR
jgi:hypothetical protein